MKIYVSKQSLSNVFVLKLKAHGSVMRLVNPPVEILRVSMSTLDMVLGFKSSLASCEF